MTSSKKRSSQSCQKLRLTRFKFFLQIITVILHHQKYIYLTGLLLNYSTQGDLFILDFCLLLCADTYLCGLSPLNFDGFHVSNVRKNIISEKNPMFCGIYVFHYFLTKWTKVRLKERKKVKDIFFWQIVVWFSDSFSSWFLL